MKGMSRHILILFLAVLFAGCGYHVLGRGDNPAIAGIKSVAIPVFRNDTYRPDVESVVTSAVVDEFLNVFDVVGIERADAVFEGTVREYELAPVSYGARDVVREYRLNVVISMRVVRKSDGAVLWEDKEIKDYEDFVVDTTNVMATKDAEAIALRKISGDTARLLRERMLEGF